MLVDHSGGQRGRADQSAHGPGEGKREFAIHASWTRSDVFFADTRKQILEYFDEKRTTFDIPLAPEGTEFQKKVWRTLCAIPFGEARTYKEVAVGMANSRNPIPIIIPCHRVIDSTGMLTGFAHGLRAKERLLNFERSRHR